MQSKMMNAWFLSIVLAVTVLTGSPTLAIDEEKLIASGERITASWKRLLSMGLQILSCDVNGIWSVDKHILIGESNFDIRKTDSIVSPYMLTITFDTKLSSNTTSPNANYHASSLNKMLGFKTANDALRHTQEIDFDRGFPWKLNLIYALQKESWVLKDPIKDAKANFFKLIQTKENRHSFEHLFVIKVD